MIIKKFFLKKKALENQEQKVKVDVPSIHCENEERERIQKKIDQLKSEIAEQIEKITSLSDKGVWAYLHANGYKDMELDSKELLELMHKAINRYPFAKLRKYLRPIGNAFTDEHPYPSDDECLDAYEEFIDELWHFERSTRKRLKNDLLAELGHSENDVQTIECIGKNGSIEVNMTSVEQLQNKAELSEERFEKLKQCALDYLNNKSTWEDDDISLEKMTFENRLVDFFINKTYHEKDNAEHELLDELEKFTEEFD